MATLDVYELFGGDFMPPLSQAEQRPTGSSATDALRRAIRKAADEAATAAPVRLSAETAAAARVFMPSAAEKNSLEESQHASSDDDDIERGSDEGSSSSSSADGPSVVPLGGPKSTPSGTVFDPLMLIGTPANRAKLAKLMTAIGPKSKKGPVPAAAAAAPADGDGPPQPVSLSQKYQAARKLYHPVTYADEPTDDEHASGHGRGRHGGGGGSPNTSFSLPADEDNEFHKNECFLCGWGDEFHDAIAAPLLKRLNAIFEYYYGKAENAAIAQMMHLYYTKKIYDPALGMPMLSQATALAHIEGFHTLEPRIAFGEIARRYLRLLAVLENEIFFTNNGFNRHTMNAYHGCVRMLMAIYKSDMSKMNYYNAKLDIDLKRLGALTQLVPSFTQIKRPATAPIVPRHKQGMKRARDADGSESDNNAEAPGKRTRTSSSPGRHGDVLEPPSDHMLL